MPEVEKEKETLGPAKVSTCEYFEHELNPHIHGCTQKQNKTKRCGYDMTDLKTCPLVGKIVEKVIRPSKPLKILQPPAGKIDQPPDKGKETSMPELKLKDSAATAPVASTIVPDEQKFSTAVAPKVSGISTTSKLNSQPSTDLKGKTEAQLSKSEKRDVADKIDAIEEKSEHQVSHAEAKKMVLSGEQIIPQGKILATAEKKVDKLKKGKGEKDVK